MVFTNGFRWYGSVLVMIVVVMLAAGNSFANDKKNMGGWEIGSKYNRHYNANELDAFKGWVIKVTEVTPMPGMSKGVALHIRESKDPDEEPIVVHLCPTWFMSSSATGFKRGDRVKVRGVWAEIDGKDVFMASKVKKGDYYSLKIRLTKDGTPFWTMDAQTLEKERAAAGSN